MAPLKHALVASYGAQSQHAHALQIVSSWRMCCLIVLDGLDEVDKQMLEVLEWLQSLAQLKRVAITVASRPVALVRVGDQLASLGFVGRKVAKLTDDQVDDLSGKVLTRLQVCVERVSKIKMEMKRRDYESLVSVPLTLPLLVHVLDATHGAGEPCR